MALSWSHPFVSVIPDDPGAVVLGEVTPQTAWNAAHAVAGCITGAVLYGLSATSVGVDARLAYNNAGAANGIQFASANAAAAPSIAAIGTDTNISLNLITKGTGVLQLNGVQFATTPPGGTTTFLRADGTYATPAAGGSPGGSSLQIQYNNAGAFGGANVWRTGANQLDLSNGVTAQQFRIYNTTDNNGGAPTNSEYGI